MKTIEADKLAADTCLPCEGGVEKYSVEEATAQLTALSGWKLTHEGARIRKDWRMQDFSSGIAFFDRVAKLAEREGHHPDLHLEAYRHVWIELGTHAISGLSRNDFVLAAKIDDLAQEA